MAVTRLSDIIEPEVFTEYVTVNSMVKTGLIDTGVVARNSLIEAQLRAGSDLFNIPGWNDLGEDEPNAVNDDPAEFSVPLKVTALKQRGRKFYCHQSWSAMNFASELAGSDAIQHIQNRVVAWWARALQRRIIATMQGVLADNVANDAGDMVKNVSVSSGTPAAANLFSRQAFIDAAYTLGDRADDVKAVFVHSVIAKRMQNNNDIDFIPDAAGEVMIPTFMGCRVIVDDSMPVTVATTTTYLSVLLGAGAIGFGMTAPNIADGTEVESIPSAGLGGGQQVLHSRNNIVVHPAGYDWIEGTLAEASPLLADLRQAEHWNRVVTRKHVPIAFLITND